jgi:Uma2 family endonuclease
VAKYLGQGVQEVWLLDAKKETVEVHAKDGSGTVSGAETIPSRALPGLKLPAAAIFDRA